MASQKKNWFTKFANAFRGLSVGVKGQNSFYVHIPCAIAVIVCSMLLHVSTVEVCILLICVAVVLAAEFFNSSIEFLAKAITTETNDHIRDALDIASAAVLTISIFSLAVGLIILLPALVGVLAPLSN